MLTILLLLAMVATVATPAAAQQGWTGTVANLDAILPGNAIGFGAIDSDAAGNVRAIWNERAEDGIHTVIQTTLRSRETGIWSDPVEAFRTSATPGVVCTQLLVDDGGNAAASCHVDSAEGELVTLLVLRYSVSTDSWAVQEMESAIGLLQPHLAMDDAGNTYAVWRSATGALRLRRHTASTDTWSSIIDLPFAGSLPRMVADAAGNLFVTWRTSTEAHAIKAAHYDVATSRWSDVATMPVPPHSLGALDLAIDPTGHVMVVWGQWTSVGTHSAIRASRYAPSTGWGPVIDVASRPGEFAEPRVVTDDAGNALVAWLAWYGPARSRIEAATYAGAAGTWSPVTSLSPFSSAVTWPVVTDDDAGNATIAWLQSEGPLSVARSVRYTTAAAAFGPTVDIAPAVPYLPLVWMTSDRSGAATVMWQGRTLRHVAVETTRWEPTPPPPAILWAAVVPGALRAHLRPLEQTEPDFFATNYEYSINDGATWIPRQPASTASPFDFVGLPGGTTVLRLRAVNRAGAGPVSEPYPVTLSAAPDPPAHLSVTAIVGELVTVAWDAPTGGVPPQGYVLEGGGAPGEVLATLPTGSIAPRFTLRAPTGVFYIRLRAFSGAVWSEPSNEVPIYVNVALPPSAPTNLLGLVNGSTIALSWMNTLSGGAPTSMRLSVSGSWTGTLSLPFGETFSFTDVPAGHYAMSVSGVNAAGVSAASNTVTLTIPGACSGAPATPRNFVAAASGRTVYLAWNPPMSGPAVRDYNIRITGSYIGTLSTPVRTLSGAVAPGTYSVSVEASNSCGVSDPTPVRTITIF